MNRLPALLLPVVALCCAAIAPLFAAGTDSDAAQIVDCGAFKVALFNDESHEDARSKDGHYALGWTLLPLKKGAKPVDWSSLNGRDAWDLLDKYSWNDGENTNPDYELLDCLVDLRQKKALLLPGDNAYHPNKNHAGFGVAWSPETKGVRYVLVENDQRWDTSEFWLVTIDQKGMRQVDVSPALTDAVTRILRDKRPLYSDNYSTTFSAGSSSENKPSFHEHTVDIKFDSEIPKSLAPWAELSGTITLSLPEGKITKAWSDDKRDNPFIDDPALAKADKGLNATYAALQKTLTPAAREALKKEQHAWISQRDADASETARDNEDDPYGARNKSLLDSTRKRTAELKARLAAKH